MGDTAQTTSHTVGEINLQWSISLIQALTEMGIHRFVISPGSRSTPLALAATRNAKASHWIITDERSAAFFALGQGKQSGQASALICTSGSAVANWLPAVVEANHSATPLLLLSADRPVELHGRGANQTIEQESLFGNQVRASHPLLPPDEQTEYRTTLAELLQQVAVELQQPIPGPVHINIPLREPLLPNQFDTINWIPEPIQILPARTLSRSWLRLHEVGEKLYQQPGVILCGQGAYGETFAQQLLTLAERLDCVVMVDPLSNLRWGLPSTERLLTHYDGILRSSRLQHHRPRWVIQMGDLPLSKTLSNWLSQQPPAHYFNIQHRRRWSDPATLTTETFHCKPEQFIESLLKQLETDATVDGWCLPFIQLEQQASRWQPDYSLSEQRLLQSLQQSLPAHSVLFSANSMMIRDIDGWCSSRELPLQLHANRGASGIDGNLSTACGIRSVVDPALPMVTLLGDLTLAHDLGALTLLREDQGNNHTVIVVNNGGGNIFNYLPPATLPEFEPLWLTPPNIDFSKAAALYEIPYQKIDKAVDLEQLFTPLLQTDGPKLIEWVVDPAASIAAHQEYWESLQ